MLKGLELELYHDPRRPLFFSPESFTISLDIIMKEYVNGVPEIFPGYVFCQQLVVQVYVF